MPIVVYHLFRFGTRFVARPAEVVASLYLLRDERRDFGYGDEGDGDFLGGVFLVGVWLVRIFLRKFVS